MEPAPLLEEKVVELNIVGKTSDNTNRQTLKKKQSQTAPQAAVGSSATTCWRSSQPIQGSWRRRRPARRVGDRRRAAFNRQLQVEQGAKRIAASRSSSPSRCLPELIQTSGWEGVATVSGEVSMSGPRWCSRRGFESESPANTLINHIPAS